MAIYSLASLAEADIDGIWFYIAQDDPEAANRFVRKLTETFWTLALNPTAGRRRFELSPELYFFPYRRYCIFYQLTPNGVEVSRVLHSARDIDSLFEE